MICPGLPGHQHQQSCQPGIHHGNQQHFIGNNMLNHPHVMSCRLLPFLLCWICAFNCILKMCAWSNNQLMYIYVLFRQEVLNVLCISTIFAFAFNGGEIIFVFLFWIQESFNSYHYQVAEFLLIFSSIFKMHVLTTEILKNYLFVHY